MEDHIIVPVDLLRNSDQELVRSIFLEIICEWMDGSRMCNVSKGRRAEHTI